MFQNCDLFLNDLEKEELDLSFHSSGIDQCTCGNIYGPRIRRYHLIHFVLEGTGCLIIDQKKLPVKPGQAFYIPPGLMAAYQADFHHPWKYCWIGFQGTRAEYFTRLLFEREYVTDLHDVTIYERYIMRLLSCTERRLQPDDRYVPEEYPVSYFSEARTVSQHLVLNGLLKELFSEMVAEKNENLEDVSSAEYPDQIKAYIDRHYNEHLQIQHIADYLHLNPRYLTAIFKKKFRQTPKQYLTGLRIEKAKILLADTEFPLQVIANAVGLENPFSFSRLFKEMTGFSPSQYRKQFPTRYSY